MDLYQLVKECKHGSAAAQKCLFDMHADRLMAVCCRYIKNQHDAEEILLDGFYKFFRAIHSFSYVNEAALYAWLKKIMINECLMYLRKKKSFQITTGDAAAEVPVQTDMLDRLSADEIVELIIQLPVGYRTVFNLYETEGMSHKEIAEQLQITEGTSKSQLSKAKQLLQKMIIQKDSEYAKRFIK